MFIETQHPRTDDGQFTEKQHTAPAMTLGVAARVPVRSARTDITEEAVRGALTTLTPKQSKDLRAVAGGQTLRGIRSDRRLDDLADDDLVFRNPDGGYELTVAGHAALSPGLALSDQRAWAVQTQQRHDQAKESVTTGPCPDCGEAGQVLLSRRALKDLLKSGGIMQPSGTSVFTSHVETTALSYAELRQAKTGLHPDCQA